MSSDLDFLGADKTAFMKSSLQVFVKPEGESDLQYVGKTNPEVTISPNVEVAEWWDNTSGVQSLFVLDPDKVDFKVGFQFAQVLDENALAVAMHGVIDRTDPNVNKVFQGSDPGAFREGEWRFVGRGRTGRAITLIIYRGIVIPSGSFTPGAPGAYANLGVEIRALQDTTRAVDRDLAEWQIQKVSAS
jgi:hypothetical protein